MDPKFKAYKTGMDTILERYPCGRGTVKDEVPSITYANVIVEKSSSFLAMNYRATLVLAVARLNQLLKATVPMSGLLGLRTEGSMHD